MLACNTEKPHLFSQRTRKRGPWEPESLGDILEMRDLGRGLSNSVYEQTQVYARPRALQPHFENKLALEPPPTEGKTGFAV